MEAIKLTNECIDTVKMDTEFINWKCPNCGKAHRTIEWAVHNQELWCDKCKKTIKYSWE